MKALVTGCAGFIGSHLVDRLLEKGNEVVGIDCFTDYYSPKLKHANLAGAAQKQCFTLIERDIINVEHFPDVDYVFHMAAQPGVRASWGANFEVYLRNNVKATQRLLEFILLTLGLGFILSLLNGILRDIGNMLSVCMTFLLFLTPILYAKPTTGILAVVSSYNPLYYLVSVPRELVLMGTVSEWKGFVVSSAFAAIVFLVCLILFHLTETRVTERI